MKRSVLLAALRVAGYHDDVRAWVRLYTENRVSRQVANEQWQLGKRMRSNGVRCSCYECNK